MRGACALVTTPNKLLLKLPFGPSNWVWLKMLKNSPRNSTAMDSVIGILFDIPKSVLRKPGPWKNRALELPKCPRVSDVTAHGRKYWFGTFGPAKRGSRITTGPTRFGSSVELLPVSDRSPRYWLI